MNPRVCTCLEKTFMKYDRNWPRIFGLNACGIFLNIFFFRKSAKKSLYVKNHFNCVLWPREVLFQMWKPSMEICHCQIQICTGGIKKRKTNQKKNSYKSITTSSPADGMPNKQYRAHISPVSAGISDACTCGIHTCICARDMIFFFFREGEGGMLVFQTPRLWPLA